MRSSSALLPMKQTTKQANPLLRTKKQKDAQKSRDASLRDTMNEGPDWRLELVENASRVRLTAEGYLRGARAHRKSSVYLQEPTPLVEPKPKAPKELQNKGGELAAALSELEVAMAK